MLLPELAGFYHSAGIILHEICTQKRQGIPAFFNAPKCYKYLRKTGLFVKDAPIGDFFSVE